MRHRRYARDPSFVRPWRQMIGHTARLWGAPPLRRGVSSCGWAPGATRGQVLSEDRRVRMAAAAYARGAPPWIGGVPLERVGPQRASALYACMHRNRHAERSSVPTNAAQGVYNRHVAYGRNGSVWSAWYPRSIAGRIVHGRSVHVGLVRRVACGRRGQRVAPLGACASRAVARRVVVAGAVAVAWRARLGGSAARPGARHAFRMRACRGTLARTNPKGGILLAEKRKVRTPESVWSLHGSLARCRARAAPRGASTWRPGRAPWRGRIVGHGFWGLYLERRPVSATLPRRSVPGEPYDEEPGEPASA